MDTNKYAPPFHMTDAIIAKISEISELVGSITAWQDMHTNLKLRRENRIKTIYSSLAIENNTLSLDQVTAIVNGKRVLGTPKEIQEVKNAFDAYEQLLSFNPYSVGDLLKAHRTLMNELVREAGMFRSGGVGVFNGDQLIHMAPPANLVPELMNNLLTWAENSKVHPLVKSCAFHYEFEFIHPFADGNGRMGRMWNTLLLYQWKPIFAWLPIETLIRERQQAYYAALAQADQTADATPFVEFLLTVIYDTLREIAETQNGNTHEGVGVPVTLLLEKLGEDTLSAQQIMERLGLKSRASFRKVYLVPALEQKLIEMEFPDKPNSSKQRYRRK
ncbi:MAG: Fic family protein [Christensenellales bacterium]|jgi:Fic family protein